MRKPTKQTLRVGGAALVIAAASIGGASLMLSRANDGSASRSTAGPSPRATPASLSAGPSFDCGRAATAIERAICASPELSRLDAEAAERFAAALAAAAGGARPALLASQRAWLGERDRSCAAPSAADPGACLRDAYKARAVWLEATGGRAGAPLCDGLEQAWRAADRLQAPYFDIHSLDLASDAFRIFDREEDQQGIDEHPKWAKRIPQSELLEDSFGTRVVEATGATPRLTAVIQTSGTMSCSSFEFYEPSGGVYRRVEAPEPEADPQEYCMHLTEIARVGSSPAFVQEVVSENATYAKIIERRPAGWRTTCEVTAHFRTNFTLDAEFCGGPDCRAFSTRVLGWVRELDAYADERPGSSEDAPPPSGLRATGQRDPRGYCCSPREGEPGWADGGGSVPTFGRTYEGAANSDFMGDQPLYGLDSPGGPYLVRISPASFAWRISEDYVVGVYRRRGGKLEPVAGYVVLQKRAGLKAVERAR